MLLHCVNFVIVLLMLIGLYKLYCRETTRGSAMLFGAAWFVRLVSAIALGVLYRYHYSSGDTFLFFNDSVQVIDFATTDPRSIGSFFWNEESVPLLTQQLNSADRSLLMVKWILPFVMISGENYWWVCAYMSIMSLASAWFLFATIRRIFPDLSNSVAIAVLFFPSAVFWSSGVVKETIALAAIYVLTGILIRTMFSRKISVFELLVGVFSFYNLWGLKYYWAVVYAVIAATTVIVYLLNPYFTYTKFKYSALWLSVFALMIFAATLTHPNFYLSRLLEVVVENNVEFARLSTEGEYIKFYDLQPTWQSVLLNSPWALLSGLYRPFFWETHNMMSFFSSLENLLLMLLFLGWFASKPKLDWQWMLPIAMYVGVLTVFLTLSTPNFGTLSRYRIGVLPFFVFALTVENIWFKKLLLRLNKNLFRSNFVIP